MRPLVIIFLCAVLAVSLIGCGGGSNSGASSLKLYVTDAPIDADAINVKITSIEVQKDGEGWITLKQYSPALEINLMKYQAVFEFDDDPATQPEYLLLDAPLATGHYTMVRLHVESVDIKIGEQTYPVDMNNIDQTGIKLNREFDVESGDSAALLLDFNGKASIVEMGTGSYKLQPVIAMVPKSVCGTIRGSVLFQNESQAQTAVPDGATVEVYTAGTSTLIGSAAISTEDGSFAVGALLPGTYDLKINATGYAPDTVRVEGIVLGVAETKDLGQITVSLP